MPPKTFSADNKSDKFSACFRWPRASNKIDQLSLFLSHLHAYDGVYEEEHGQEETDVGQRLERLHEGPEKDADRVALPQQFDEARRAEEAQEPDVYESNIVECFLPKQTALIFIPSTCLHSICQNGVLAG